MAGFLGFGGGNKQQPQNGNQQQNNNNNNNQGNQQQGNGNQQNNNGVNGGLQPGNNGNNGNNNPTGGNGNNANPNEPVNPLDTYSKMFDNPSQTDAAPSFALDPEQLNKIVSSQDFTQGLDPAVMTRLQGGDWTALNDIMNHVGRNVYKNGIEHGGVLNSKFVEAREGFSQKQLPSKLRSELTSNELAKTPNFQHPVVRKQLTEVAQRLQQMHPDASPSDIAQKAKDYITELATALNPEDPKKKSKEGTSEEERGVEFWDSFFKE